MKKILSAIFCVMICLGIIVPNFLCAKNSQNEKTFAVTESVESQYVDSSTIDLISINPSGISNATIETNCAPFDESTNQRMQGSLVTPTPDQYGQVKNFNCSITNFTPTENQSIYLWVYLIDAPTFQLSISVYDNDSSRISWDFDSTETYMVGTGWKLFELKFSTVNTTENYTEKVYKTLTIKYYSELEDEGESYDVKTNESFSFYHIFLSKSANSNQNSGKIYSLDRTFYKFAENFLSSGKIFKGDSFKFESANQIFSYLYVDKYDLANLSQISRFIWRITLTFPGLTTKTIDFGDTVKFSVYGYYKIDFQIYENNILSSNCIMNAGVNIYCDEMSLGNFVYGSTYKIADDQKITLSFKLSDDIDINNDIQISTTNNNAEIDSYYKEDGVLYICVKANNSGESKVQINANIKSKYSSVSQDCVSEATIKIESSKSGLTAFQIVMWVILGSICLILTIYFIISVVKSRKNDVK